MEPCVKGELKICTNGHCPLIKMVLEQVILLFVCCGVAAFCSTRRSRVQPHRGRQYSFVEISHEIFSMVILSLRLIQEGQLSVSGERMCTILVNLLED